MQQVGSGPKFDRFQKTVFSDGEPFGPISAEQFNPSDAIERSVLFRLFTLHESFDSRLSLKPRILFGRRGSGKTSALVHSVEQGCDGNPYDIVVFRSQHEQWRRVCSLAKERFANDTSATTVEDAAALWREIFRALVIYEWAKSSLAHKMPETIKDKFASFIRVERADEDKAPGVAQSLVRNASKIFDAFMQTETEKGVEALFSIFSLAQQAPVVLWDKFENDVLKTSETGEGCRCAIRLNSSEQYDFTETKETQILMQGFLRFLAAPEIDSEGAVDIQISLPTEHVRTFEKLSTNPLADLSNRIFLHWAAEGLLRIAALRLQTFFGINKIPWSEDLLTHFDPKDPKSCCELLEAALGSEAVSVGGGYKESRLQYLLRHTQLMPRHFLSMLNNITNGARIKERQYPSERDLKYAVAGASTLICAEIFRGYRTRWPLARPICEAILPELSPTFTIEAIEKAASASALGARVDQFQREEGHKEAPHALDPSIIRDMLVEIGVVGRIRSDHQLQEDAAREVKAEFDFQHPSRLYVRGSQQMCLHPVFALQYGVSNLLPGRPEHAVPVVVIPDGSNISKFSSARQIKAEPPR
jgi:hypothetical protein